MPIELTGMETISSSEDAWQACSDFPIGLVIYANGTYESSVPNGILVFWKPNPRLARRGGWVEVLLYWDGRVDGKESLDMLDWEEGELVSELWVYQVCMCFLSICISGIQWEHGT